MIGGEVKILRTYDLGGKLNFFCKTFHVTGNYGLNDLMVTALTAVNHQITIFIIINNYIAVSLKISIRYKYIKVT